MEKTVGGFNLTTTSFKEIEVTRRILDERSVQYEEYGDENGDPQYTFEVMTDMTPRQIENLIKRIEQECQ